MLRFLLVRIASAIPVLIILSIVTFAIIQAPPGDYADYIRSQLINQSGASFAQAEEQAQAYRVAHGLDQPMVIQYFNWIKGIVTQGDFGYSMFYNKPVADVVASACRARCCWPWSATSLHPYSASASASGRRPGNIPGSTACFRVSPSSA
jgi:ABC-type dipeptide/oligopeptide/nickel transport system permease component